MKKPILTVSILLAAVLISAGSFWGGMMYQTQKAQQAQANFFAARGPLSEGQFPGGQIPGEGQFFRNGQNPNGRQGAFPGFGGGTIGQIKSINGNLLMLSTAQDVTTVNLSADTSITKTDPATLADLQPGMRITVIGQRDANGNLTAEQIMIVDQTLPNLPLPAETRTAP